VPPFSYTENGPEVTADDQNLYFGSPQNGIMISSGDGSCKVLTEENGLASNIIRSLEALDGKVYAVIGQVGSVVKDSGLMEVDLKSGISTVLFSVKAKDKTRELDGMSIAGIAADPKRHALWILSADDKDFYHLFIYYPRDQKLDRADSGSITQTFKYMLFHREFRNVLRKRNDHLFIEGISASALIDTRTEIGVLLIAYSQ
jgi:hypothetical protein